MIVAMACTKNWYHYLAVNIFSLLRCNDCIDKIYLFVETDNINEIDRLKDIVSYFGTDVILINYNKYVFNYIESNSPNYQNRYSTFCFCKLFLSDFIKEDKVLYIDTDAIVVKSIESLNHINMDKHLICGVKDIGVVEQEFEYYQSIGSPNKYVNSGFVLMNLKLMRKKNCIDKFINLLYEQEYRYPDQDVLNIVCSDSIKYIHSLFNCTEEAYIQPTRKINNLNLVKCFHFTGLKEDWLADNINAEIWYTIEDNYFLFLKGLGKKNE